MRTWTGFVRFVVQPSTGLLWAHEHSDGGWVPTKAGVLLLSWGITSSSDIWGARNYFSSCLNLIKTWVSTKYTIMQHLHWHWSTGGDKPNTGSVFPDIRSFFRILVCYTSSTNDRNSSSLTENLKQFVQKVEILKGNFSRIFRRVCKTAKSDY